MSEWRPGRNRRTDTKEKGRALKDEREVVLLALLSHEKNETFSNVLVKRTLDDCRQMSAAQRAFIKRLLEGVIERKTELDARIEHFTGRSVSRLHPTIHQILRMGIYQILYMDAVPDSAACNEAVCLAKKHAPARLSGFVNGVLRNAVREKEKTGQAEAGAEDWLRACSIRYSMPEWLVGMWSDQLGAGEAEKLMEALMEIRPVTARFAGSLDQMQREELAGKLRASGVIVENGRWLPYSCLLRKTSDLRDLPGFREGLWTVQDESSMLAVEAAGLTGTETVLDVCAAPGGKSFLAADRLQCLHPDHPGRVYSYDLTRHKTDRIREGARRLHLDNLTAGERDATEFFAEDEGTADVLFCDLPCSGLGVMGKKRDIKYRASREGLASLQQLQRRILSKAVRYLKDGGILIYSTCTINREENEENALWIEKELGLQPDSLAPWLPKGIPGISGNMIQLLPHIHGTDGFFISRFRKV